MNKPSEIEYCEKCGTMVILGVCRRCDPNHRDVRKPLDTREKGMAVLERILDAMSIEYEKTPNRARCDYRFANGTTAMIRTQSQRRFLPIANATLHTMKADVIIAVVGTDGYSPAVYIIPQTDAITNAIDRPRNKDNGYDGESEYILAESFYMQYRDRYDLLGANE